MKFKILGSDLKRVMTFAGSGVSKDESRPILRAINCRIRGKELTATGCNGFKIHQVTVPCEVLEGETVEDFNIKAVTGILAGLIDYVVEVTGDSISYEREGWKLEIPLVNGNFLNIKDTYPKGEKVFSIRVSPKFLRETLKVFGNEFAVQLDFYDENHPFTITSVESKGDNALIMPVRMPH